MTARGVALRYNHLQQQQQTRGLGLSAASCAQAETTASTPLTTSTTVTDAASTGSATAKLLSPLVAQLEQEHESQSPTAAKPAASSLVDIVYKSPFDTTIRRLKLLSLTSCIGGLIGAPVLLLLTSSADALPTTARIAVAVLAAAMGSSTTALLHWVTKPYVRDLVRDEHNPDRLHATTFTFTGGDAKSSFLISSMRKAANSRAFVSFHADGRDYFVHKELVQDEQLLQILQKIES
ncbi:hypothetical protein CAOG_04747 [Capsaspora owczarzaki ATCC 30864]|uniref:hypothetical protein n=1 Tax=Capsaspora owczarzaki (strain ATCC 30864) TaxID=595528 RepID=UPI0001FE40C2|nr:hypothetical protein CAOG_04747 [Capsaspora owczarzaki ATCC 30864]|eukprot:XP_004347498.1 hypothetical protein CAOG_04747 [Capsaspora owczarzaki ATCC 30864]